MDLLLIYYRSLGEAVAHRPCVHVFGSNRREYRWSGGRVSYTNGETVAPGDSLYRGYSGVIPKEGRDPTEVEAEGVPRLFRGGTGIVLRNLNVAGRIRGEI